MKKLLILFMAFGLVAASCNNDKGKGPNISKDRDRDRDDYNSRDDEDRDDRNKNRDDDEDADFSSGGSWSSSDKRQWMELCRDPLVESMGESRATSYCECVMEKISKKYSSFRKMNTQGTTEEGQELGLECVRELGFQ